MVGVEEQNIPGLWFELTPKGMGGRYDRKQPLRTHTADI